MKIKRLLSLPFLCSLIIVSLLTPTLLVLPKDDYSHSSTNSALDQLPPGQKNMTFTSDVLLNLTSGNTMTFTTGNQITFRTTVWMQFMPTGNPLIEPCYTGVVVLPLPLPQELVPCSWWEILDPTGHPTGFEFHVDEVGPDWFHVDEVFPGPFLPQWPGPYSAWLKIDSIDICDIFWVDIPYEYDPPVCSWWEILDPPLWSGVEFHVDYNNDSCMFHIDQVVGSTPVIWPWPYSVVAEEKITEIEPCNYYFTDPAQVPEPCSWWEITYPKGYTGYEFHVDTNFQNGTFHVD